MFKRLICLVLLLSLLLLTSAVGLAQDDILLYGGNQDIDNIDPATGENYSINAALRSLYDALFIYRASDTVPHLVESWDVSDDAIVWTFNLVENAVFHDGSSVNADAVVYSLTASGLSLVRPPGAGQPSQTKTP